MQEWLVALIGAGGALGGSALGLRGALRISREEREQATHDRIREAFGGYLAALYPSVAELRELPALRKPDLITKVINAWRGKEATWIAQRKAERRVLGDNYRQVAYQLAGATARLQVLPLDHELREVLKAATDYIERLSETRSPELKAEWPQIHSRLMAQVTRLGVKESDRPSGPS